MALSFITITNSIAALSVSGVTIKDIDEIPEAVLERDCPILYPEPAGFITDFIMVRDSFGPGTSAKITVSYNMTYTFLYSAVGSGRGLFDVYDDMVTKMGLILDAIIANDNLTGAIDFTPDEAFNFGPTADPAGSVFHGAQLVFGIVEFVN